VARDPGIVTADGSPVDIYRALPRPAIADAIHAALRREASVLDLGCGTGRFAVALTALGHPVIAVDVDPAMVSGLDHVAGVESIVADIVGLDLGRRVDAVLLASHLVNDDELGPAALATAGRHLAAGGSLVAEVYPAGMDWTAAVGHRSAVGPVGITVTRARVAGDRLEASVRYDLDGRVWDQPFEARLLDETALDERLAGAGFTFARWLDAGAGWFVARRR
jgi:SAM-dependent methyltransferase